MKEIRIAWRRKGEQNIAGHGIWHNDTPDVRDEKERWCDTANRLTGNYEHFVDEREKP